MMTEQPISLEEFSVLVKARLLKEIAAVKPVTLRDHRLMAIRLAESLSNGNNDLKNDLYDAFTEMMGIARK